jgi:iron(III) transport system substrate-binding protein
MKKLFALVATVSVFLLMASVPVYADQGAWDKLYEAAKKEGEVIYNPAEDLGPYKAIADAFQKKFPGIRVRLVSVGATQLASRIVMEAGAKKISMDVSRMTIELSMPMLDRDIARPFDWAGFDIPSDDILLDGKVLRYTLFPYVFYYNNTLVSEKEAPKTWDDLLDPKWKGKMCFHNVSPNITTMVHEWGPEKWRSYVKKLAMQEAITAMRGMEILSKIQSGERVIGNNAMEHIMQEVRKGAPFTISPVSPQGAFASDHMSFKDCPHPNAAKLLMAWLVSPEGRAVAREKNIGLGPEFQQILKEKGIRLVLAKTIEQARLSLQVQQEFMETMGFVPKK